MVYVYSVLTLVGAALAVGMAYILFAKPFQEEWADPTPLSWVRAGRTLMAIVLTLVFAVKYGVNFNGTFDLIELASAKFLGGVTIVLLLAPVMILTLLLFQPTGRRRAFLRRLALGDAPITDLAAGKGRFGPAPTILGFFVYVGYALFFVWFSTQRMEAVDRALSNLNPLKWIADLVFIIAIAAALISILLVAFMATESGLNSGVAHPSLPAVMAFVYTASIAFGAEHLPSLWGTILKSTGGSDVDYNAGTTFADTSEVSELLKWGALAYAAAIALVEIVMLKTNDELSWRERPSNGTSGRSSFRR